MGLSRRKEKRRGNMLNNVLVVTERGLKSTQEITNDDKILVSNGLNMFFTNVDVCDGYISEFMPVSLSFVWRGKSQDIYIDKYDTNRIVDKIKVDLMPWVQFLGLWTIDGTVTSDKNKTPRKVVISTKLDIDDVINKLPFRFKKYKGNVTRYEIYNTQLALHLKQYGKKLDRKIPEFIKYLPKEYLNEFIRWIYYGAGRDKRITTKSWELISDLVEIFIKANRCIHIANWSSGVYVINEQCREPPPFVDLIRWKTGYNYIYVIYDGYGWWMKNES